MEISIVTPVYNEPRLRHTLDSVLSQEGVDPEIVVVDGDSTDETVDILEEYQDELQVLIREPDEGVFDAMNKGVEAASGDVIGILNADDRYQDEYVLRDVLERMAEVGADTCYGDLVYVDEKDEIVRHWDSGPYNSKKWYWGWMPPHPTFFVRREVYKKYGTFDLDFPIAADYELMLRFLLKNGVSTTYVDRILVRMATGGQSNESVVNIVYANREVRESWKKNGLSGGVQVPVLKPLRKIGQFFERS